MTCRRFVMRMTHTQKPSRHVGGSRIFKMVFITKTACAKSRQDSFLYYKKSGSAAALPSASMMRT